VSLRFNVVKFFADGFSELAQHGCTARRELLVISGILTIPLHTDRQVRRIANMFWMLVPRVSLVLVGLRHGRGEVSTTLPIPLRPTSAGVVVGGSAGIEVRHIGF